MQPVQIQYLSIITSTLTLVKPEYIQHRGLTIDIMKILKHPFSFDLISLQIVETHFCEVMVIPDMDAGDCEIEFLLYL